MTSIYVDRRAGQRAAITHAMEQGQSATDKGDYSTAISEFSEAIRLVSKLVPAYAARGAAYAVKGASDKSVADYTKAIELEPDFANAYCGRRAMRT